MKRWTVARPDRAAADKIASLTDLGPFLSGILAARGLDTPEKLERFFNADELSDPFLLADMQNAVDEINSAVDSGLKICVFGDYDCDGVTSAAMLTGYLESMGADVGCVIPDPDDGYGLSVSAVEKMHADGVGLIITVDNGITAAAEAKRAAELGMRLVITDHHQPPEELPEAAAVVDPHRRDCPSPYKYLCGAGVVLKLCAALDGGSYDMVSEQYLDLAAIATIADVVPLTGENRIIVSKGIMYLKNTENLGILALMEKSGVAPQNVTASQIAYSLVPKINAARRVGSPLVALKMITGDGEAAEEAAAELIGLNDLRRQKEREITAEALRLIDSEPEVLCKRTLTLCGRGWHRGVLGVVAARLAEAFSKPVFLLSLDDRGEAVGSARSFEGLNVFKCLESCRDLLVKYGGHELAGGLTVREENVSALKEAVEDFASLSEIAPRASVSADGILEGRFLTPENAASLKRLEPFGAGNPEPVFALSGAEITAVRPLKDGLYTKVSLLYDGARCDMPLFNVKSADFPYSPGDRLDIMASLSLNEYKGNVSVNLKAVDLRPHGIRQERFFAGIEAYEKFRLGRLSDRATLLKGDPTREELVGVYKYIGEKKTPLSFEMLCAHFAGGINSFRMSVILDAFCDTGLLEYSRASGRIRVKKPTERVDIDSAKTLKALRDAIGKEDGHGRNM